MEENKRTLCCRASGPLSLKSLVLRQTLKEVLSADKEGKEEGFFVRGIVGISLHPLQHLVKFTVILLITLVGDCYCHLASRNHGCC